MDIKSDIEMTSSKPYFFRAILEWIEDNGLTPHVIVDATVEGVDVPFEYVNDGEIVLNISSSSVKVFENDNVGLSFEARFNGKLTVIFLPMLAIKAVFSKENQQGIFFNQQVDIQVDGDASPTISSKVGLVKTESDTDVKPKTVKTEQPTSKAKKTDSKKKDKSHLTIIK